MKFTLKDVRACLAYLHIQQIPFTIQDIKEGMNIELEHGSMNPLTNITNDDPILTCKITLAHLFENPKYYDKLKQIGL